MRAQIRHSSRLQRTDEIRDRDNLTQSFVREPYVKTLLQSKQQLDSRETIEAEIAFKATVRLKLRRLTSSAMQLFVKLRHDLQHSLG